MMAGFGTEKRSIIYRMKNRYHQFSAPSCTWGGNNTEALLRQKEMEKGHAKQL